MQGIKATDHFKPNLLPGLYVYMYTSGKGQRTVILVGKTLATGENFGLL